jgi:phage shock protein E
MQFMENYWPALLITLFLGFKVYASAQFKKNIEEYKDQNPQYIDVRTIAEYMSANNPQSKNIPLDQVGQNLQKVDKDRPVIVVCRSGNRSGIAVNILKKAGFTKVYNGGPWQNIPAN